jgi:sugar phosphate isomerase/epimerase
VPHRPLSVQLYTVRDAIALDLPAALERVAAIGYRTVEPYDFVARASEYAELIPANGLSAPTAHAQLVGQPLEPIFAAATKLGIGTVIDPHIDRALWTSVDDIARSADALGEIARAAADHGLRIGYHNHWWELQNRIAGVPALEVFVDRLSDAVVLEVDTYWAEVGGVPAAALLERLGDRVVAIHVKDGAISQVNTEQVAVGAGKVDVLAILAAAPNALRVVELDDFDGDVFTALADSLAYLTANGESA